MYCKNCGCENNDKNIQCEVCGAEINNENKQINDKSKVIIILAVALLTIIIVIILIFSSLKKNEEKYVNNSAVTTDNSFYAEEKYETNNNYAENASYSTISKNNVESTTLSEIEINRQKALDYLEKANSALNNGKREGALQMADAALEICEDEDIKMKYDEIYEYAPFELYENKNMLQVENSGNSYNMDSMTANDQTEMENCLVIFYDWTDDEDPIKKITYNLKGNYDVVSGIEFISNATKNIEQEGFFEIFGDGKKLYTSQNFQPSVLPKEFSLNVTGVNTLIIVFHGHTDHWDSMNNAAGYSISNFMAFKNLP